MQKPALSSPRSLAIEGPLSGIFLALLAAVVLAQGNPFLTLPNTDGGFFLYAGSQILKGKLPYVDFWDSKGPGVYYLNALGLAVGHGLRWGVWLLEYAFLLASLVLLYIVLRRQWGMVAAAFGVIISSIGLNAVLDGGNLTEEYSLLFNSVALYVFWMEASIDVRSGESYKPWRYLIIGLMAGLAFSFRANNIGVPLAIAVAIALQDGLQRRPRALLSKLALMAAGFMVPVLISAAYFAARGALPDFLNAALLYNLRYAGSRRGSLLNLLAGFGSDKLGWPAWIALAGGLLATGMLIHRMVRRATVNAFEVLLAVSLWIEVLLSSLSWRLFGHYFITWMPAMALLSAYLLAQAVALVKNTKPVATLAGAPPAIVWGVLIIGLLLVSRAEIGQYGRTFSQFLFHRGEGIEMKDYLSDYIDRHTGANDRVLTWPGDPWVNFASERVSPVRLLFYPIFDAGTITSAQGEGYLDDLQANPPALIINCIEMQGEVPSLDAATRQVQTATRPFLYAPPYMQQVFDYVAGHYHVETKMAKCTVYRQNP